MKITVKLAGRLINTMGFSEKELDVPPGTTAAALLAVLAIDSPQALIIARNGWGIAADEEIREDDRIIISPPFSGG